VARLRIREPQAGTLALLHQSQSKPGIELAVIVRAATDQTCDCTFDPAHARKIALAIWTFVKIPAGTFGDREREIMTTLFISDSQVATSLSPVGAMGQDPLSASTKLRENVRKFMEKRSIDLTWMMNKLRI